MPALLRLFSSLNKNSTCSDEKDTYCLLAVGVYLSFELFRQGVAEFNLFRNLSL